MATAFGIASISWAANVATITTTNPHGLQSGYVNNVQIAGVTPSGYNGYYAATVTGANTFTVPLASNPGAYVSGGTSTYATQFASAITATPDCKIILWGPNGFTADDAGNGPFFYLSAAGTTLSGQWTGLTLAQAALAASQLMYSAYQAFANDLRIYALVQKQDLQMLDPTSTSSAAGAAIYVFPSYRGAANNVNTPTSGTTASTMANQIHPSARGQLLATRGIIPKLQAAIAYCAGNLFY